MAEWRSLNNYEGDIDMINSPPHYSGEIEVIEYIDDKVPDPYSYAFGNAIKYLSRHLKKGAPAKDLRKCQWYINYMLKELED